MKEITGNIWDFVNKNWIIIPTNGAVKKNGACVMGRGLALQAKQRYPGVDERLGEIIKEVGNHVWPFDYNLLSFPVKHHWAERADIVLIERSAKELALWSTIAAISVRFYLPRVGCGNGKLDWADVKPILEKHLDDRFTVVTLESEADK